MIINNINSNTPQGQPKESNNLPSSESITCYVRCRPLNQFESQVGANCVKISSNKKSITIQSEESKEFSFDAIIPDTSSQNDIFNEIGMPTLKFFLGGYNATIFAYGQTGSGKTHTMLGPIETLYETNNSNQGLIPNIINYIFNNENEVRTIITNSNKEEGIVKIGYSFSCACIEIYQEHIMDLLNIDSNEDKLSIREDPNKGMYIEGLTEIPLDNAIKAKEALLMGLKNRHVASTSMNSESSRSHLIYTLFLESSFEMPDGLVITRTSRLHLVDLAGSERQKMTGTVGERIKEAGMINKSLSTLGNVINAVIDFNEGKTKHVPFRDSKLTYYLKDSIGGNSKTVIIGNISQSFIHFAETLSTLMFIQRAKMIKNKVTIIQNVNDTVKLLQSEIKKLNKVIEGLNLRIKEYEENAAKENFTITKKKSNINDMGILLDKINHLFSFEEKINEHFRFLETNTLGVVENFLVEKETYENELKSAVESFDKNLITQFKEKDCLSDKVKIFHLTVQNKKLKKEIQVYKAITNFFIKQTNIDQSKKEMSKEIINQFIQTNKELKEFFSKNYNEKSEYIIVEKGFINNLNLQIKELKSQEEQSNKLIDNLQSENFLLNMEVSRFKDNEKEGNNNIEKIATPKDNFYSNLRNSLCQFSSNTITFNPFGESNQNKTNNTSNQDKKIDELQEEIDTLILDKQELRVNNDEMNEYIKELNSMIIEIGNEYEKNAKIINEYMNTLYNEYSSLSSKYNNIHKYCDKYFNLIDTIFKTFKSKEKKHNYPKAIELMQNMQETLELHRLYINSKAYTNYKTPSKNSENAAKIEEIRNKIDKFNVFSPIPLK